jgi:hypothetical protein
MSTKILAKTSVVMIELIIVRFSEVKKNNTVAPKMKTVRVNSRDKKLAKLTQFLNIVLVYFLHLTIMFIWIN